MEEWALREAEVIALARWQATLPPLDRRRQQQQRLLEQIEMIAGQRWRQTEPTPTLPAPINQPAPPAGLPTYRLFDAAGQPIACHLCGQIDRWVAEADGEQQTVRMFVCEHEPLRIGGGLVRQVSTVSLKRVARCEVMPAAEGSA